MQLTWSHMVMYVYNLDDMLDFYTRILGFEVTDRGEVAGPGSPELIFMGQVATDHHQFAMLPIRESVEASNSVNHVAFRVAGIGDVREMIQRLETDGRATDRNPLCHGNAWSIYFQDPENNGIEVFCDTPFHVRQPQGKAWDPAWSDEELLAWTEREFSDQPEFGPIDEYYARRAKELANK